MKKHTHTRLWRMGTKIILSLLALLLCFSGCVQKPDDGNEVPDKSQTVETQESDGTTSESIEYDRTNFAYWYPYFSDVATFREYFKGHLISAKVKILSYEGTFGDQCTIFRVEVLKEYKNETNHRDEPMYILQMGTPEASHMHSPLFRIGSIHLLTMYELEGVEMPFVNSYFVSYSQRWLQQICYKGVEYVVYKHPQNAEVYFEELYEKRVYNELANLVRDTLIAEDPVYEAFSEMVVFRYSDVEDYLEQLQLEEQEREENTE